MRKGGSYRIAFLTGNKHKVEEAKGILSKFDIEVYGLRGFKVEMQSNSLEEISRYAALEAYKKLRKPLIVEDSGLFIEELNGFPGPYSSYAYKTIGLDGILQLVNRLAGSTVKAYFKASITCICPPYIRTFTGVVHGHLASKPAGSQGFGYDPIFVPAGYSKTFAELGLDVKNKISHRSMAFRKLAQWLCKVGLAGHCKR